MQCMSRLLHCHTTKCAEMRTYNYVAVAPPEMESDERRRYRDASFGTKRTSRDVCYLSASLIGHSGSSAFRLIHHYSVDVAHGLVLLYGIGTRAVPSWDSKTRWNNLSGGLVVSVTTGPSGHANSPHPSSRKGHHSTARWGSIFLTIGFDPARFSCCCRGLFPGPAELGAVNPYAVHDHSQPACPGPRSPFSSRGAWRSASPRL